MATAAAKPPKLTESMVSEFLLAESAALEKKAELKPLADKVGQLYDQLHEAMLASGKTRKKVGAYTLVLETVRGGVGWKKELVKRVTAEELEAIEASAPEKQQTRIEGV